MSSIVIGFPASMSYRSISELETTDFFPQIDIINKLKVIY